MKLRKMVYQDYDEVYQLWLSCKGMGLNNLDDSKEGILQFLKRNPKTCFVAIEDSKVVGTIIVGNDGRRGYIYHTAVHPDYRHQHIATKMIDKALQALQKLSIHKVALVVFAKNENGNIFWEKLGFTTRSDIIYRNKALVEMIRYDT